MVGISDQVVSNLQRVLQNENPFVNIVNVLDENKLVYVLATKALVQSFHLITTIHFKLVEFFGEVLVLGIDEKKNF